MSVSWLKSQIGTVLTAVTLLIAVGISYGQLWARQADQCTALEEKADKAVVEREMDQIQAHLARIEAKVDQVILGQAK
jgi:hypothetical protein